MSKVVIQGNASGTGNFTIAAPNSDTNRTLTLPDEAGEVVVTDGTTLVVNNTNNRVGIGIAAPQELLHLLQTGGSTIRFQNPGQRVWSIGNDGTSFVIDDVTGAAERMRIDSSGRVTMPNQVSFRANKTVDENLVSGESLKVTFDSLAYDVGNNFSLANKQFVAPVTGKYIFSTGFRVDTFNTTTAYYIIKINVSNASYQWIIDPNFSSTLTFLTLNLDAIADMDANDVAYVTIYQNSGTASHIHGSLTYDWFSGHLLG